MASKILGGRGGTGDLLETRQKQSRSAPPPAPRTGPLPAAARTASEMPVLLGHAVVAARGPPACGCVHSEELVGKVCSLGVSHSAQPHRPVGWNQRSS